jgi:hypothetical protein
MATFDQEEELRRKLKDILSATFSGQPTGFIKSDSDPGNNQVLEIIRNIGGGRD